MPETNTPAAPTPALSKKQIFFRRLFSFLVLWTIILSALFSGNRLLSDYVFLIVMVLLAWSGLIEFYGMVEKIKVFCFKHWGVIGGVLLMVGTFYNLTGKLGRADSPARVNDFETSFLILFVLGLCVLQFLSKRGG